MLLHARCSGHCDELPGALLRDDDVCPSEDVERRRRVRFREDCVSERITQPEARYGDAKLAVKAGCVSAQRFRDTMEYLQWWVRCDPVDEERRV